MRSLKLEDENGFDRDAGVLAAGALAAGLLAAGSGLVAGSGWSFELLLLSFGGSVGVAAGWADPDDDRALLSAVLGVLGGVLGLVLPGPAWLAGAATGGFVGMALALREETPRQVGSALATTAALGAGAYAATTMVDSAGEVVGLLPGGVEVGTAAVLGIFALVAAGGRRLDRHSGQLAGRLLEARRERQGKEASVLDEAVETVRGLTSLLDRATADDRRRAERVAEETVRSLVVLTRRSDLLRETLADRSEDRVADRIDAIDTELQTEEAPRLRREIEATREELAGRRETRERLESELARLEVRQHRCVSALERLRMAVAATTSADASDGKLEACVDEVDSLNREVEWRQQSVEELLDGAEEVADLVDDDDERGRVDGFDASENPPGPDADEDASQEGEPRGETSRTAHAFDGE